MTCKRHPYELGVGVCASCLRERLLALIASQSGRPPDPRRSLDPPPPFPFPRSVSPYVEPHRRSVGSGPSPSAPYPRPHCRFFSTPQVGPSANPERIDDVAGGYFSGRKKAKKFSLFSALFGYPRSDDVTPSKPGSWFSGLFPGRLKKKPQPRSNSLRDRGMSPARDGDGDGDSACSSGYSTESSPRWRRPEPTPVRKFPSSSKHGRAVSGFAVCLSPLVRPSPKPAVDLAISSDLRGALSHLHHHHHHHRRHVSAGPAPGPGPLLPCRSRKLADLGRFR